MKFKNAIAYRLTQRPNLAALASILHTAPVQPIAPYQEKTQGWAPFLNSEPDKLTFPATASAHFLKLKTQERLLPKKVVNRMLKERITIIETHDDRRLSKKERTRLQDELISELLPKAFILENEINAFIDDTHNLLVVDSASLSKADDFVSFLRKTLGSLEAVPLFPQNEISLLLTLWAQDPTPRTSNLALTGDYKLTQPETEKKVTIKGFDASEQDEIDTLIWQGYQVVEARFDFNEETLFTLDEKFRFKGIKSNIESEQVDAEDEYGVLQADLLLTATGVTDMVLGTLAAFGGEYKAA